MFEDNAALVANSFPKHANYKFSGVDWLGEVPEHWEKKKIKLLFEETSEKGHADAELLSVTQSQGVVPRTWLDARTVLPTGGLDGFKFIRQGEFAISLRSFQGGIEICHHDGIISPAYTTLRLVESQNKQFWRHLFKSHSFIQLSQLAVIGIREGKTISYPLLRRLSLSFPPIHEQKAIVNLLDAKTKEIEEAIKQKQRTIELLEEYKHSLIEQAVTKGLDLSVPMKDSGVDWLDEVPEQWETPRFFDVLSLTKRTGAPHLPLLSVYLHLGVVRFDEVDERRTNATSDDLSGYQVVEQNEFVANNQQAWRGSVGVSRHHGIISPAYLVFKCTGNYHPGYLNYLMRTEASRGQFEVCSKGIGSIQRNLQWSLLKSQRTLLPAISEQIKIVNFLNAKTKEIEEAKSSIQVRIDYLKEYKDSLIESAVTGKIKVA